MHCLGFKNNGLDKTLKSFVGFAEMKPVGAKNKPIIRLIQESSPFLSIVVPAYNEEKRIEDSLRNLMRFSAGFARPHEIIVVIEKSSDRTVEIAQKTVGENPVFRVVANAVQRGKGYAVKTGMMLARGEYVFFMDADLSTPLEEVEKFLRDFELHPDLDVLIGNRKHPDSDIVKSQNFLRKFMGKMFNNIVQFFAVRGIKDTQCGFKAFRKKTVSPLFSRQTIDGFSFDVEILLLAQGLGFRIGSRPVTWVNSPDSKVRIIRDSWDMFVKMMKVRSIVRQSLKLAQGAGKDQKAA